MSVIDGSDLNTITHLQSIFRFQMTFQVRNLDKEYVFMTIATKMNVGRKARRRADQYYSREC